MHKAVLLLMAENCIISQTFFLKMRLTFPLQGKGEGVEDSRRQRPTYVKPEQRLQKQAELY